MHLPPHPVHAWRTFEPIYGLLDQLQTGSIDAVQGKPVMADWDSELPGTKTGNMLQWAAAQIRARSAT
jgi:hypothetical protein